MVRIRRSTTINFEKIKYTSTSHNCRATNLSLANPHFDSPSRLILIWRESEILMSLRRLFEIFRAATVAFSGDFAGKLKSPVALRRAHLIFAWYET
jgi:hypothetical protein